jgi:DNA helicase-2/ATP-dependent DNA helicase PcrA
MFTERVFSKSIISPLLKRYKDVLEFKGIVLKEGTVLSMISKAKAKGFSATDYLSETRSQFLRDSRSASLQNPNSTVHDTHQIVAEIYQEYEITLRRNNSLDFDDLLLFGVKLFTNHQPAISWCSHILVDEL